jgi:uncharacterized membrane-anchored protein YjiN (DUF445 family)
MKGIAAAFLVVAALAYVVARRLEVSQGVAVAGWVGYLKAAGEAGMVGGLADWFAVTALFRRPLGLPIPHTAIIPTRKDAIGASLGDFVGSNFLAEDVVRGRLASAELARRLGSWLAVPPNADRVTQEIATAARGAVGVLRDEDVQAVIEQTVTARLATIPAAPALGTLLGGIVADGSHHGLVDVTVDNLHLWLRENRSTVVDLVARQAPNWTPRFVDERVGERVHAELLRISGDVQAQPDHPLRKALDTFLIGYAEDLRTDESTQARIERLKETLLSHPQVRAAAGDAAATVRRLVLEAIEDPASELRRRVSAALTDFGARLGDEPELRAKLDVWAADAVVHVVVNYRDELTTVITDTVERWDGPQTARKIELQVGRDLQFIRINGTVVGALAGVAIYGIGQLLG